MTTVVAAGTQVVSLGPMLSFPEIANPAAVGDFSFLLDWWAAPSAAPTFNFVQMLGGPTLEFPFWWTVVEAATQEVTFPNLMEAHGINPFIPGDALMQVTRVYRPGTTVNNFDFWDLYQQEGWTSWATNAVLFSPMANGF